LQSHATHKFLENPPDLNVRKTQLKQSRRRFPAWISIQLKRYESRAFKANSVIDCCHLELNPEGSLPFPHLT
jgi:hypothetical protein